MLTKGQLLSYESRSFFLRLSLKKSKQEVTIAISLCKNGRYLTLVSLFHVKKCCFEELFRTEFGY